MTAKAESGASALDVVKLLLAAAIIVAGGVGFYMLQPELPAWARALLLLAAVGIGLAVGATSAQGGRLVRFMREANAERRKVVWPTRQETIQTTLIVLLVVIIVGIMLWLFDMFNGWLVSTLLGA